MAYSSNPPHKRKPRHAGLQRGLLVLLVGLILATAACQPDEANEHAQVSPTPSEEISDVASPVIKPSDATAQRNPVKSTPTPQPVTLCVPSRLLDAVAQRNGALLVGSSVTIRRVVQCVDTATVMAQGHVQLALVPGDLGVPAGSRPLALVVPFGSGQDSLTMDQALEVLDQGSSSIEVFDWSDVSADQTVLRVDGAYPGDPDYPVLQQWSVVAAPGYEDAAADLAPALSAFVSADQVAKLAAVGDVMLDRRLGEVIASGWVEYPFEGVSSLLGNADLTIGNLESALGDLGEAADKGDIFQAPPEAAQALEFAGFDLLSLANNHSLDFGKRGLLQGIELLRERGIGTVGAGIDETAAHMPYIAEVDGLKLAFLAYVDVPAELGGFDTRSWVATSAQAGVAWADPERIRADVDEALRQADLVIILLHGGNEYIYQPSTEQLAVAHAAIEAGAHLVLGHHTHVVQGVEFYAGGVIAYGLGDLAFSHNGVHNSMILNVWLDGQGVRSLEIVPLLLLSDGRPAPADGEQATYIRDLVYELSNDLH